jgi:cysteine desulfurase
MKKQQKIYFDHSATTPIDPRVLEAMLPYMKENFGNASSAHSFGQEAMKGVDWARETIANFFGAKPKEVIFTAGATESDNLATLGVVKSLQEKFSGKKLHVITSSIEHPAILEPIRKLAKEGISASFLPVSGKGLVEISEVKKAITDETVLISIMYVNNEIGTIQPIAEIGALVKEVRRERQEKGNKLPLIFHTDAVQAVNYCNCRVDDLGVDLVSISGHKIYGPKGIGALYVREGIMIEPLQLGGHQERGIRSGTLNTAGIVGLGKAVELVISNQSLVISTIRNLRDKLIEGFLRAIPDTQVNGDLDKRVASNVHFSFSNTEGESILLMLDLEGIAVSTGSACASGSLSPSHVLLAMGIPEEIAHGSLRVTLGRYTTEKEVDKFLAILPPIVKKLRGMSPIKK